MIRLPNRRRALWCAAAALPLAVAADAADAVELFGLNNGFASQVLFTFDSETRTVSNSVDLPFGTVSANGVLLSIDVRPATGELFGFTSNHDLVVIDPADGSFATVGNVAGVPSFIDPAIDFNPTVDRIRLVSGSSNFRVNPNDASVLTDGTLAFDAGDPNEGETPNVASAAYTNSVAGATTTTLFDLEALNEILVTQDPVNDGLLQTVGETGIGIANGGGFTGFDIDGVTGEAFLIGNSGTGSAGLVANTLYGVDLDTGLVTELGAISGLSGGILRDLAVVPEPATAAVLGLASLGLLGRRRPAVA